MQTDIDELVANPHRHFGHPSEVLSEPTLTNDEKRRILESWKLDARRLAESTAENMAGGEETDLRDVSKVLVELNAMGEAPVVTQPARGAMSGVGTAMILGGVIGAGAGLLIIAMTAPSLAVIAQAAVAGVIIGGATAAVRNAVRS